MNNSHTSLLKFDISGSRFHVLESLLLEPNKSAFLFKFASSGSPIRQQMADAYIQETDEYFFQRSPEVFSSIISFYKHGKLNPLPGGKVWLDIVTLELDFWRIPQASRRGVNKLRRFNTVDLGTSTVPHSRSPSVATVVDEVQQNGRPGFFPGLFLEYILTHPKSINAYKNAGGLRRRMRNFLEDPSSSMPAKLFSFVSIGFVLASVIGLVLGSLRNFQV